MEEQLHEAIAQVVSAQETSMVTKWVALIETIDGDGQKGLWTLTSDGVMAWDTVGMLQHGLHIQQNQTRFPDESGED